MSAATQPSGLLDLPARCANVSCPNESDHRSFALVEAAAEQVFNARPLRLWMCAVCATALRGLFAGARVESSARSA
ncbi:MAG: hypothetical protein ACRCYU_07295 [Nocardioides sp.]